MKHYPGLRFLALTHLIACFFGALPLGIGMMKNPHQVLVVPWWKVLFGPFSWFMENYVGKNGTGTGYLVLGICCIVGMIAEVMKNSRISKTACVISTLTWYLVGFSIMLAWT
jgi:hypothetical protein